ncbi:hypothetical protein J2Z45_004145 [Cohnella lubricantis]|nr:hypothetical protein [Cohnella lubricantis]
MFYSYNPPKNRKRWVHEYRKNPPPGWLTNYSDYRSVPREWFLPRGREPPGAERAGVPARVSR